jgi:D-alanyl-D-alanine carboxypeptidase (penicillin-binding protein 5/6)
VGQADIWLGKSASVPLIVEKALTLTLPRRGRRQMKVAIQYRGPVAAPVLKGTQIGKLVVSVPGISPIEVPLVAAVDVQRLGFIGRILAVLQSILWGQSI